MIFVGQVNSYYFSKDITFTTIHNVNLKSGANSLTDATAIVMNTE